MKTFKLNQSPFRINEWQLVKDEFHEVRLALSGPDYLMLNTNQTFEIGRDGDRTAADAHVRQLAQSASDCISVSDL